MVAPGHDVNKQGVLILSEAPKNSRPLPFRPTFLTWGHNNCAKKITLEPELLHED